MSDRCHHCGVAIVINEQSQTGLCCACEQVTCANCARDNEMCPDCNEEADRSDTP